jgi:hypothetical protein
MIAEDGIRVPMDLVIHDRGLSDTLYKPLTLMSKEPES